MKTLTNQWSQLLPVQMTHDEEFVIVFTYCMYDVMFYVM